MSGLHWILIGVTIMLIFQIVQKIRMQLFIKRRNLMMPLPSNWPPHPEVPGLVELMIYDKKFLQRDLFFRVIWRINAEGNSRQPKTITVKVRFARRKNRAICTPSQPRDRHDEIVETIHRFLAWYDKVP